MLIPCLTTLSGAFLITAGVGLQDHWGISIFLVFIAGLLIYVRDDLIEQREYDVGFNDGRKSRLVSG